MKYLICAALALTTTSCLVTSEDLRTFEEETAAILADQALTSEQKLEQLGEESEILAEKVEERGKALTLPITTGNGMADLAVLALSLITGSVATTNKMRNKNRMQRGEPVATDPVAVRAVNGGNPLRHS